jgi:uncharacterized protein (DUF433 family)
MTAPARKTATNWRKRIHADPAVLAGKPVINGTRVSVELVLELLAAGWTTDEIVEEYDRVTAADVRACLAYAAEALKDETVVPVRG